MNRLDPYSYLDRVISGDPVIPPFVEILPVNPCNHRCVFCISADYRMTRDRLAWPVLRRIISEVGATGHGYIRFCGGGEPLLHPYAKDMLLLSREAGVTTDLTTNGSLLQGELLDAAMQSCEVIRVSFNGGDEESYTATHRVSEKEYDRVLANLRSIKTHPLRPRIQFEMSCVITLENQNKLSGFLQKAALLEADKVILITDTEANSQQADRQYALAMEATRAFNAPEGMDIRIRRSRPDTFIETELPCPKAMLFGTIAANGDFYSSCHHVGMPEFRYGNVMDVPSLRQILEDPEVYAKRMAYLFGKGKKLEKFVMSRHNLELVRSIAGKKAPSSKAS